MMSDKDFQFRYNVIKIIFSLLDKGCRGKIALDLEINFEARKYSIRAGVVRIENFKILPVSLFKVFVHEQKLTCFRSMKEQLVVTALR